jgi:teichuronic acid biosynthesis glycosyltransferase TuaH
MSKADGVFANSAYLKAYAQQYNQNSTDIGQGCALDMYDPEKAYPAPADIKDIPFPRIGYLGFLTGARLDISLLENLATKHKDWNWVMVGPEDDDFKKSKLHSIPNVFFTGAKFPNELPAYIHHLDVCLNPQLLNEVTIGNYPRKIDEYLAMGKPVVATDTPAMHMFLPVVSLATGADVYSTEIANALFNQREDYKQTAVAMAREHTWDACVEKVFGVIEKLQAKQVAVAGIN